MRVRPHVEADAGRLADGSEVIEEDERPDGTAEGRRQDARDDETVAEVAPPPFDDAPGHVTLASLLELPAQAAAGGGSMQ